GPHPSRAGYHGGRDRHQPAGGRAPRRSRPPTARRTMIGQGAMSEAPLGNMRPKDAAIMEMTDTLERFETILLQYSQSLETELDQERRRDDLSDPLVTRLAGMIGMLREFYQFFDTEVSNRMIVVADR